MLNLREYTHNADEYFAYTPDDNGERFELIEGEFVAMSASTELHQTIVGEIYTDINVFIRKNKGKCKAFVSPFDVYLDEYNVVQPDVFVICDPEKRDGKRCNGAPDFVVEVLSTNRKIDLTIKLALYADAGVREYWIVDPENEKTVVYFFERSDLPNIYTFSTPIPVGIYDGELSICIGELLG